MENTKEFTSAQSKDLKLVNHKNNNYNVINSITNFDCLPDIAHVRIAVVMMIFACSRSTVWRHVKSGLIPTPIKVSERITAWNVGAIRKKLMEINSKYEFIDTKSH